MPEKLNESGSSFGAFQSRLKFIGCQASQLANTKPRKIPRISNYVESRENKSKILLAKVFRRTFKLINEFMGNAGKFYGNFDNSEIHKTTLKS